MSRFAPVFMLALQKNKTMKDKKGRRRFLQLAIDILSKKSLFHAIPFIYVFPCTVATAFFSCTKTGDTSWHEVSTKINIESKSAMPVNSGFLDLFVYNMDKLGRLDSHSRQNLGWGFPLNVEVGSRSGMKRIIALANWPAEELEDWGAVSSLDGIGNLTCNLADDNPASPRMTGTTTITAGAASAPSISMQALSAKIKLATICCDFSGKVYEGLTIKNARVYLTNVCVNTTISPDDVPGTAFVNIGGYSDADMKAFRAPELLERNIYEDIGAVKRVLDISLFCYPAEISEDDAGKPQTKLVLEGEIGGRKYYYPIRLGDYTGGVIRRDMTYQIDLKISRLGGDDPEATLQPGAFEATVQVLPWDNNDSQTVNY